MPQEDIQNINKQIQLLIQQKNTVIEALLQRINDQENLIEMFTNKKIDSEDMISTTIEHLHDTGYIYSNFYSNKRYILLDISNCSDSDQLIYQKSVTVASNNIQTWQNAVYPEIKEKLQFSNSYCQMILNNCQNLEDQIAHMKSEIDSFNQVQSLGSNKEKNVITDYKIIEQTYSAPQNAKIKSRKEDQAIEHIEQKKQAQKSVDSQNEIVNHKKVQQNDWSNLFPTFQKDQSKKQSHKQQQIIPNNDSKKIIENQSSGQIKQQIPKYNSNNTDHYHGPKQLFSSNKSFNKKEQQVNQKEIVENGKIQGQNMTNSKQQQKEKINIKDKISLESIASNKQKPEQTQLINNQTPTKQIQNEKDNTGNSITKRQVNKQTPKSKSKTLYVRR